MDINSKLKFLELAHNIASCCDYVPEHSEEEVNELKNDILQDDYNEKDIEYVLKNYEGYSDGDLVSIIMENIKQLNNK